MQPKVGRRISTVQWCIPQACILRNRGHLGYVTRAFPKDLEHNGYVMADAEPIRPGLDRMVQVEECLTHQQQLLDELNDVVTDQASRIAQLERQLKRLRSQQEQLRNRDSEQGSDVSDEKPPHY